MNDNDPVRGKVIYILVLVTIVQFIYPITENNAAIPLIIYQTLYATLMVAGFVVARGHTIQRRLLMILGPVWFISVTVYTFNQDVFWAHLLHYPAYALYQGIVAWSLFVYIFSSRAVTRDVIFAAVAVYLLLGAVFVPIYGVVETLTVELNDQHAFSDARVGPDDVFPWQTLMYYSYATLTTLGYGDVLPLTATARSIASVEAATGVLYTTVIMARLVGLYAAEQEP